MNTTGRSETSGPSSEVSERGILPLPADRHADHDLFLDVDGASGFTLWQRVRDVRLWASFQPDPPPSVFGPGTPETRQLVRAALFESPEIAQHLRVLNRMVRSPRAAPPHRIATACLGISAWADERKRVELALAYAEAAAIAAPRWAEAAAVAGSLCTRVSGHGEGEPMASRAARWLRRAVRVARRTKILGVVHPRPHPVRAADVLPRQI